MIEKEIPSEVLSFIKNYSSFWIIGHIEPDGDDISSLLTLGFGLRRIGKKTQMLIGGNISSYLLQIPLTDVIITNENKGVPLPEAIIIVDSSSPDRIGIYEKSLGKIPSLVIDHHATNTNFGKINWVDSSCGACAQMIFRLLKELGVTYDSVLATINLLGIQTDTGFFKYSNISSSLFRDCAELLEFGADSYFNSQLIFENKKIEEMRLLSVIIERIRTRLDGSLVYSYIDKEAYKKTNTSPEETNGFIGELRSIKIAEVAILFSEESEKETKISFRSKSWFDVSKIALNFGGGGHPRASGCTIFEPISQVIEKVADYVEDQMKIEKKIRRE